MSLQVVDPNAEENKKKIFVDRIKEMIAEIEANDGCPRAIYIHVFQANGTISRMKNIMDNFNAMEGIGVFQFTVSELCNQIDTTLRHK